MWSSFSLLFLCNTDSSSLIGECQLKDDANLFAIARGCVSIPQDLQSKTEDDDVAAERERIHADPTNTSGDVLRMVDLVKVTSDR